MPMGMPYPKGDMAMQKKKMSMSEMMGVEKKMPEQMMPAKMMAKGPVESCVLLPSTLITASCRMYAIPVVAHTQAPYLEEPCCRSCILK